ncbi:HlyD family efflux transporter periplasmic adaptor subunit [Solihabitans fulvus]|uniref:HlyD family efflux transporter periplasmic adaptor subunit n=1 Tax=Solihabitans fulvus TaxID=1892852 RepID=A0A5B2XM25_9PSEU|nr:HlyD family efflux transporter periplasmic adaptor subunit [Solihabitans fulvus]KAA2264837.1 HlyD family efflux transporter periplasmic adaptor subunit [Solihabitans fulvus]
MKRGRRAWVVNGVLIVLLLGVAWGGYELLWPGKGNTAATGVRTISVNKTSVVETVSAAGTVQSSYTSSADFSTSGTVSELDVKIGDVVAAGQTLAKLNPAQANQQLTVAKDNLAVAQENQYNASVAPATTTKGGTAATPPSANQLQAAVDQAQLAVDQAQDAVTATVLTAPGAGTVTAITGAVGQKVGSGSSSGSSSSGSQGTSAKSGSGTASSASSGSTGFLTITNMTALQVHASVAEIDVAKIKAQQDATVTVNALPDTPVAARVGQVDLTPTTSNNVVQYGVTLALTSPPAGLLPGQSASVAITVAKADNALAIPSAALQGSGTQHTVTVLSGGQQQTKTVEIGVRSESLVQITSGLAEGDQVVLSTGTTTQGSQNNNRGGGSFPGLGTGTGRTGTGGGK